MSEGYTAERLLEAAGKVQEIGDELAKELADTLHVYGYAWQAEVRALRERIAALLAERAASVGNEKDAERWRKLKRIMESAKGGASLEMNQEFAYYEKPEPGSEVQLQWYPDTPIGFYKVNASSLDEAIDGAEE